jgi:glycosyltransferase involved in cell wall biosynthesis
MYLIALDHPLVVIIPSYNNEKWCERNIRSALDQDYSNYRIIFIDDYSTDNTLKIVQDIINDHPYQAKVTCISNRSRKLALQNLYEAIHSCNNYEIVLTLDGDDWLSHNYVLRKINQIYQDPQVWMTYGQYIKSDGKRGGARMLPSAVVKNNSYRTYEFVTTHLRTFYAGLFKQIKKEDLMLDNVFLPMAWDLGFMYPMLEMAQYHSRFIAEELYVYNVHNPMSDSKVNVILQNRCAGNVCSRATYQPLADTMFTEIIKN